MIGDRIPNQTQEAQFVVRLLKGVANDSAKNWVRLGLVAAAFVIFCRELGADAHLHLPTRPIATIARRKNTRGGVRMVNQRSGSALQPRAIAGGLTAEECG